MWVSDAEPAKGQAGFLSACGLQVGRIPWKLVNQMGLRACPHLSPPGPAQGSDGVADCLQAWAGEGRTLYTHSLAEGGAESFKMWASGVLGMFF